MNYRFFEIQFENEYAICIKGLREPSMEEASAFCANEVQLWKAAVIGVFPIEEKEARMFYNFENVDRWPVFGMDIPANNLAG